MMKGTIDKLLFNRKVELIVCGNERLCKKEPGVKSASHRLVAPPIINSDSEKVGKN